LQNPTSRLENYNDGRYHQHVSSRADLDIENPAVDAIERATRLERFADALRSYALALSRYRHQADFHIAVQIHYVMTTIYCRIGQSSLSFERIAQLNQRADQTVTH
jgi:hypothetical protein